MRPGGMSTRSGYCEHVSRRATELHEPDDDAHEPAERQDLTGEKEEVVEAELRARDRALLFGLGHLREERRPIARARRRRSRELRVVLRELRAPDGPGAGPA